MFENKVNHSMNLGVDFLKDGWAELTLKAGEAQVPIVASYIADSFRDLAEAAVQLLRGSSIARVAFQDEPGQHVIVLKRGFADQLQIKVFRNEETFSYKPGAEVLSFDAAVVDFAGQVLALLHTVRNQDYLKNWRHPFPEEAYQELLRRL